MNTAEIAPQNEETPLGLVTNFTALTEAAKDHAVPSIHISRRMARGMLDYIAELEGKVSKHLQEVPLQVGDIVREVGQEEPTGEIIEVKEGPNETAYRVKLYEPTLHSKSIIYYRDEIELMERAK